MADRMYDDQGENFRIYRGYRLDRLYPQSMWKVSLDDKPIPELPGMYTVVRLATADIDAHIVYKQKLEGLKKKVK